MKRIKNTSSFYLTQEHVEWLLLEARAYGISVSAMLDGLIKEAKEKSQSEFSTR